MFLDLCAANERYWLQLMTTACDVVAASPISTNAADPLIRRAVLCLQSPSSTDAVRLASSRFLAASVSNKKSIQSWSQLVYPKRVFPRVDSDCSLGLCST